MTSKAHSFGSDFVGNLGKRAFIEVEVFDVIFPRDVKNHPQHSCVDSVYVAFRLYSKRPGFTTIEKNLISSMEINFR